MCLSLGREHKGTPLFIIDWVRVSVRPAAPRPDWIGSVSDGSLVSLQLRPLYLWLHKSLSHTIRKRGFVHFPDPCFSDHPPCPPTAPGAVETLRHGRRPAGHRHPAAHALADCWSSTYHSGGMITHSSVISLELAKNIKCHSFLCYNNGGGRRGNHRVVGSSPDWTKQ